MLITIVLIFFTLILVLDYIPGRKSRPGRVNAVYCLALAVSFCMLLMHSLDIPVPSPTGPIRAIVEKLCSIGGQTYGR